LAQAHFSDTVFSLSSARQAARVRVLASVRPTETPPRRSGLAMPFVRGLFTTLWAACCLRQVEVQAFGEAPKYLFVSSPITRRILYAKLPKAGCVTDGNVTLLDLPGLNATKDHYVPQGLAVDQYRKKLYVGDPDLGRLVAYDLSAGSDDGTLKVGEQQTVASGVDARWVTVDGLGNVYFSDEAKNRIMKVSAEAIDSGKASTAEVLYEGKDTAFVSAPGGIVADNFFVYWVNKLGGAQAGSLIRGLANSATTIGVESRKSQLSLPTWRNPTECVSPEAKSSTRTQRRIFTSPEGAAACPRWLRRR